MDEGKDKQKLIDILFEISFMSRENPIIREMERDEHAEWIRDQLRKCRFEVVAVGSSYGVLKQP